MQSDGNMDIDEGRSDVMGKRNVSKKSGREESREMGKGTGTQRMSREV